MMRPYENSLMLNIEMVSKVIRTDTVLRMMHDMRQEIGSGDALRTKINDAFKGTIVMTEFNKLTYRIDRVDWNVKVTDTFPTKKGDISYLDHYRTRYGIEITDLKQPLLVSPPTKRDMHRGETNDKYLVPELCVLTGLTDDMRANFTLMRDLKSHLIVEPPKRVAQLQSFMKSIMGNTELKEEMSNKWGLRYPSNEMVTVNARVLNPEKLIFAHNAEFLDMSKPADWTNAFRSRHL
jgi:aubergine-like protein